MNKAKRFGHTLLTAMLVCSMVATPVLATPSIGDIKDSKEEAEREVQELQSELNRITEKISKLEAQLIEKGEQIAEAEKDLKAAKKKEKQQYEDMKLRIQFMYEAGQTDLISSLLEAETFSDLLNKAEYVKNIHEYDRKMLHEYVDTQKEIVELKDSLEKDMEKLESLQTEFMAEEETLNQTIEEKRDEVKDLDARLQRAVEEAARKRAEEERRRQEEERRRQEEEERRRQEEAAQNNESSNDSGSDSGDSSDDSSGSQAEIPEYEGSGDTARGNAIVAGAQRYLGVPYVWGGTSSSGVDCSGLVYLAHQAAGISVARQSGALGAGGKAVSAAEAKPGDVVCYSGHVGIYVGGGQMIHAPRPGKTVCYSSVNYRAHWFRRYW